MYFYGDAPNWSFILLGRLVESFRHALLTLFTAQSSQDLAFGAKGLKNIQTLVTLNTVAMGTKKPPQSLQNT